MIQFRAVKISERLPDLSKNIFFYNEHYPGGFTKHYDPLETVEIKKGQTKHIKDVKVATDIILQGFTYWLELIEDKK